ncbi:VOC family protein [Streptomyces sp. NPDC001889]
MLTTRYVTGSPNWLDLGTPDLEAATDFYAGIFGWTFASAGPEAGGYGMFTLDGGTAAAGMTVPPEQGPPAWNIYFQSADAAATAEAVRRAGGTVVVEPMDVFDRGRMAVLADRAGVGFGIWQPALTKGLDVVNAPGALCWLELYTPDPDADLAFYTEVFGWETTAVPYPDGSGSYTMTHPAGESPEAMFAGLVPLAATSSGTTPHWLPYFAVQNCDATVTRAGSTGATLITPPVDLQGVGRFAQLSDPWGPRFAVMQGEG